MVEAREREQQAFELKKAGNNYREIGIALGVTKQGAHQMVMRVLAEMKKLTDGDAEDVRRMEVERLDAMLNALWKRACLGEESVVDRVLKIMERRAKLMGLDAPTKITATLTHEEALKELE